MKKLIIDADIVDAIVGVHVFFNDANKVELWFKTDNPNLGGMSPNFLIQCGRAKKVRQMVNAALEENRPLNRPRTKGLAP